MNHTSLFTLCCCIVGLMAPSQNILAGQQEFRLQRQTKTVVERDGIPSVTQSSEFDDVDVIVQEELTRPKVQSYQFRHNSQFQSFRINRVSPQDGVQKIEAAIQVVPSIQRPIQIEHPIGMHGFQGLDGIQLNSPGTVVRSGQIIVEMKTSGDKQKDVAVGVFAPGSWIKSNNGVVHLYSEQFDVPKSVVNRYWIGVRCLEMKSSPVQRAELIVDEVVANSSAAKAGIRIKDRLVRWNETPLNDIPTLVASIQKNQNRKASIQVNRNGKDFVLDITPDLKEEIAPVRTIIAPTTRLNVAEQRIDELEELIKIKSGLNGQQVRLLLVGPAVNFGKEEIELQIKSDIQRQKQSLKDLLDNVANKKLGMIVDGDSFTLKKAPELPELNVINFEPHEIWETMEIGTDGKMISFATLAPRMIKQAKVEFNFHPDEARAVELPHTIHELKTGQIVFPNPLGTFELKVRKQIDRLKDENDRIRSENEKLKEQINKLRGQLGEQNGRGKK